MVRHCPLVSEMTHSRKPAISEPKSFLCYGTKRLFFFFEMALLSYCPSFTKPIFHAYFFHFCGNDTEIELH